jgi:drug/metabolite transporter (DMT)-like permease
LKALRSEGAAGLTQQQGNTVGLVFALAGFALLSCGDAVTKSTVDEWAPTATGALRYLFGAVGLAIAVAVIEGPRALSVQRPWLQAGRGLAVAAATFGFFMAVRSMPLANATSIQFTSPALTAILSAIFLGERATRATWAATGLAFCGVLVVLRPDPAALDGTAAWPLLSATGLASLMIFNRLANGAASALAMQYMVALVATPVLIGLTLAGHWSGVPSLHVGMPDWTVIARCAAVAVTASVAHLMIYLATARASAAAIAPAIYIQLLMALGLGAFFFRDYPDPVALIGAGMIVASGIYLWSDQRRRACVASDQVAAQP